MVSSIPESKGADILLYTESGLAGIQRKEVPSDFISSFTNGRMVRTLALMKEGCVFTRILCEGHFKYYPDTSVDMGRYKGGKPIKARFNKKHVKGMINDIQLVHGVIVDWSDDLADTVLYLRSLRGFLATSKHMGLYTRPNAKGLWNVPTSKDVELWILQSFPGIGPVTADAIIQHFGGEVPLKWTCTFEELCRVQNITRSKAVELWKYLPTSAPLPAGAITAHVGAAVVAEFSSMRNKLGGKNA